MAFWRRRKIQSKIVLDQQNQCAVSPYLTTKKEEYEEKYTQDYNEFIELYCRLLKRWSLTHSNFSVNSEIYHSVDGVRLVYFKKYTIIFSAPYGGKYLPIDGYSLVVKESTGNAGETYAYDQVQFKYSTELLNKFFIVPVGLEILENGSTKNYSCQNSNDCCVGVDEMKNWMELLFKLVYV